MTSTSSPVKRSISHEFFSGVGLLGKGFHQWVTAPKLMWLGIVPALIVALVFLVALIALGMNAQWLVTAATPFADSWDQTWRDGFRFVVVIAAFVVTVQVLVYTFTTVTLLVGDPFYERIWLHVEEEQGGIPPTPERGWWSKVALGIADALRILIPTVLIGIGIFFLGLIPIVGQVSAAVLGALVGGWFLTVELSGRPFEARGYAQKQRRRMLGSRRALTTGFGVASWLLFLVPFGAILVMPAAVAGATLLSRKVLDEHAPLSEASGTIAHAQNDHR